MSSDLLDAYGWSGGPRPADGRLGRIVRVDRGEVDVVTDDGRIRVLSDSQRSQDLVAPATGDWVVVVDDIDLGPLVGRVLDRENTVSRRDPSEAVVEQVLVANVDRVLIVHGLDRPLPPGRLERFLVVAWDSGAEVSVVLTKADRNPIAAREVGAVVRALAPDVQVLVVGLSAEAEILDGDDDASGLAAVEALMVPGQTVVLLGESGAGKSTLVNALVGNEILPTGEVRAGDSKGRHTTVSRELVQRPAGGLLVDTPGIRAVGIWDAEESLARVFGDLEERSFSCRFADCGHDAEPDCAVMAEVEAGREDHRRIVRYRALRAELVEQREREIQRGRRARRGRRR
ncbi:MAG TPA: ribosome small subunit-dependent GTPase A [Acidimicrobiaceae bacterium]|nr:ribosome small subunit-dependent GTPase A [Acidimicrobiaceae bacterium]HAQ23410.1 ribosome small subunit-dependent GTPase A [Acidimicrobiaceae bacterium]HCV34890.1 ribosome small subunit-dependent GTPase A [Acidimicrobiaceae bacterium]|tara:strand:- start:7714 stop:8745 length:1032 start_codon:yes stop_codon:yes gene_type:complete